MEFSLNPEISQAFRFLNLEVDLTEQGLINYEKVIAITFEWIRIAKDEWLSRGNLDFFHEMKTVSDLSYKIYNVPSQDEHVCKLSDAMLTLDDHTHILEEVYTSTILNEIDYEDVKSYLGNLNYENCKVVLNGNDMFTRKDI